MVDQTGLNLGRETTKNEDSIETDEDTQAMYIANLRLLSKKIIEESYFDEQNFKDQPCMLDFVKQIVEKQGGIFSEESSQNEEIPESKINEKTVVEGSEVSNSKISKGNSKFESSVEDQQINKYYREVVEIIFAPEEVLEGNKEENGPIYDFKREKCKNILNFFNKKAEIVFDKFWKVYLEEKSKNRDINDVLFEIYSKESGKYSSNAEFNYMIHKVTCFLIEKIGLVENNDHIKSNILDTIIDFCKKMKLKSGFIPIKNVFDSSSNSRLKDIESCLLNPKNVKRLKILKFASAIKLISEFSYQLTLVMDDAEEFFKKEDITSANIFPNINFYEIYVLISIILELTQDIIEMNKNQNNISRDNNISIQKLTINVTTTIIFAFRYFFLYYVYSWNGVQRSLIESRNAPSNEILDEFTFVYIQFIYFSVFFNILDSFLSSKLRNFCLDSNSYLLDFFFMIVSQDLTYIKNVSHVERKNKFQKNQQEFINDFVEEVQIEFYKISTGIEFDENKQDYKYLVKFLLELTSIREDVQQIFKLNLSSLDNNRPKYIQEIQNFEFKSIERSYNKNYEENMLRNEAKSVQKNFKIGFEKIKKICDSERCFSILFLVDFLATVDDKSNEISRQYSRLESHFIYLKIYKKNEFDELIKIFWDLKNFMSPQIEVISFNFSNTYQLLIYASLMARLEDLYENIKTGVKRISKDDKNQQNVKFLFNHLFLVLFYIEFIFEEIESSIMCILPEIAEEQIKNLLPQISSKNTKLFSSISWYILFENLHYLFEITKRGESEIKALQKQSHFIYVTRFSFNAKKCILLMVLISETEIKNKKFFNQNRSPDEKNVIENSFSFNMEQPGNLKQNNGTHTTKSSKKMTEVYVVRKRNPEFFDTLLLSISNMLT